MNSRTTSLLIFAFFVLISSSVTTAFHITKILRKYPEFSTYNHYLIKTDLQSQIDRQPNITILAVDNKAISSISKKPLNVIKNILSLHVLHDYYDVEKLVKVLTSKTAIFTTLYQTNNGDPVSLKGFLEASMVNEGEIAIGSAVLGSGLTVKLVKPVLSHPDTISVLQITAPIIAPGIGASSPVKVPDPDN
ncbi:fasciclin-like arabinogalactan protein 3 [Castanea sativa]|uniref:fasciclin-like arabinogalactan protein 3 n=1 Tax=Castanea sativa TaxID=21020 RepID=UPI003F651E37